MLRMASNLRPEEEGMDDILQTNDNLLRVLDSYKRVVGVVKEGGASVTQNGAGEGVKSEEVPEEASAVGGGMGLGALGGDASTLIDLADLDFDPLPGTAGGAPVTTSTADSWLDALGTLGEPFTFFHYTYTSHVTCMIVLFVPEDKEFLLDFVVFFWCRFFYSWCSCLITEHCEFVQTNV